MPGNHRLVPGIYYEKVYSKSISLCVVCFHFYLYFFDGFSIAFRNEKKVFNK